MVCRMSRGVGRGGSGGAASQRAAAVKVGGVAARNGAAAPRDTAAAAITPPPPTRRPPTNERRRRLPGGVLVVAVDLDTLLSRPPPPPPPPQPPPPPPAAIALGRACPRAQTYHRGHQGNERRPRNGSGSHDGRGGPSPSRVRRRAGREMEGCGAACASTAGSETSSSTAGHGGRAPSSPQPAHALLSRPSRSAPCHPATGQRRRRTPIPPPPPPCRPTSADACNPQDGVANRGGGDRRVAAAPDVGRWPTTAWTSILQARLAPGATDGKRGRGGSQTRPPPARSSAVPHRRVACGTCGVVTAGSHSYGRPSERAGGSPPARASRPRRGHAAADAHLSRPRSRWNRPRRARGGASTETRRQRGGRLAGEGLRRFGGRRPPGAPTAQWGHYKEP